MADSSLTLSSSPLRGGGPIGPPRLSSSPRKIETRLSDENDYQDGEISPTLDASFASNL